MSHNCTNCGHPRERHYFDDVHASHTVGNVCDCCGQRPFKPMTDTDKPDAGEKVVIDPLAAFSDEVRLWPIKNSKSVPIVRDTCEAVIAQLSALRAKLAEVERERDEAKQRDESYREEAAELHRLVDDHFQQRTKRNREFAALRSDLANLRSLLAGATVIAFPGSLTCIVRDGDKWNAWREKQGSMPKDAECKKGLTIEQAFAFVGGKDGE